MTDKQQHAIDRIRFMLDAELKYAGDRYELKTWEVDDQHFDSSGLVFVYVEWGLKGDEGTLASVFCREKVHISIGKRGGARYIIDKVRGYGINTKPLKLYPYAQGELSHASTVTYLTRQKHYAWMDKRDEKRGA